MHILARKQAILDERGLSQPGQKSSACRHAQAVHLLYRDLVQSRSVSIKAKKIINILLKKKRKSKKNKVLFILKPFKISFAKL